jgi:hypothetical protein
MPRGEFAPVVLVSLCCSMELYVWPRNMVD